MGRYPTMVSGLEVGGLQPGLHLPLPAAPWCDNQYARDPRDVLQQYYRQQAQWQECKFKKLVQKVCDPCVFRSSCRSASVRKTSDLAGCFVCGPVPAPLPG